MGSFRGKGNKKGKKGSHGRNDPDYFGNPKLGRKKGGKHDHGATGNAGKSPLLQHFFFWVVVLCVFGTVFGVFQSQIQAVVLWNDVFTMFGAISYVNAFIGWMVTIIIFMCVDMLLVS